MRVAICEDESLFAEKLADTVRAFLDSMNIECLVEVFFDANSFLNNMEEYDLIFIDCQLPDMNGIELAKKMREEDIDTEIIFVTSYPEYVYESFEVKPFRYILKSENNDEVIKALESFVSMRIRDRDVRVTSAKYDMMINLNDIVYIESCGKYSIVRLVDNRFFKSSRSISDYENEISSECNSFCRTHRSFMVNMKYIKCIERNLIIFENGENAVVARRKVTEFNKKYLSYLKRYAK